MKILEVINLKRIYSAWFETNQVKTSKDVDSFLKRQEYVVIMGESGSGKTTSLNIFASPDKPTSGEVLQSENSILSIRRR